MERENIKIDRYTPTESEREIDHKERDRNRDRNRDYLDIA